MLIPPRPLLTLPLSLHRIPLARLRPRAPNSLGQSCSRACGSEIEPHALHVIEGPLSSDPDSLGGLVLVLEGSTKGGDIVPGVLLEPLAGVLHEGLRGKLGKELGVRLASPFALGGPMLRQVIDQEVLGRFLRRSCPLRHPARAGSPGSCPLRSYGGFGHSTASTCSHCPISLPLGRQEWKLTERTAHARLTAELACSKALLHKTLHLDIVHQASTAICTRRDLLHCPGLEDEAFAPATVDEGWGGRSTPGSAYRYLHPHATGGCAHPASCPSTRHVLPARASRLSFGGKGAVHPLALPGIL